MIRSWNAHLLVFPLFLISLSVSLGAGVSLMPRKEHRIFVIAIGNDAPSEKFVKLGGAASDARQFAAAMTRTFARTKGAPRFLLAGSLPIDKNDVHLLVGEEASRVNIERAFAEVAKEATLDDVVVFFLSGHAVSGARVGAWHFAPAGATVVSDSLMNGISAPELKVWADRIAAQNQVFVLDTAFSTEVFATLRATFEMERSALRENDGRQVMLIANLGAAYEARDGQGATGGLLTRTIVSALQGGADANKDGTLDGDELQAYVPWRILNDTAGGTQRQRARVYTTSDLSAAAMAQASSAKRGVTRVGTASQAQAKGRDYALLIAGGSYAHFGTLQNPLADAEALRKELEGSYGFEVEVVPDADTEGIARAFRRLGERTYSDQDQVFIFVAGHGEFDVRTKEGYLVARDTRPLAQAINPLSHSWLRKQVLAVPVKHILLLLDSCFSGTFDERVASRGPSDRGLASTPEQVRRSMQFPAKLWLASGGKEYVSDGRPGMHSPFARRVLSALRTYGGSDGLLTGTRLIDEVRRVPDGEATPHAGELPGHEPGGDFVFVYSPVSK